MRVIDEVDLNSNDLAGEMIHKGAVQILELMRLILKDTESDVPLIKRQGIPLSVVYNLIEMLKEKKPTIVHADNIDEARKLMDEMKK